MGAGIDAYNSYAQRGSFHVIERQMAAALELFPIFARAHVLRTWAGHRRRLPGRLADRRPDAGRRACIVNCGWGTGGFKATPGVGLGVRRDDRARRAAPAGRAVRARPLHDRRADRRARRRRRSRTAMLLIRCPWCGERDEIEFSLRRPGRRRLPGRPGGAVRRAVGAVPVRPRQPEGRVRRALGAHARLPALVRRRPRHGHHEIDVRFTFAAIEYEGRAGETLAAALVRNGVLGGFRSIYRDRPRGVYTAGEEEPNALVQIGAEPMLRATLVELDDGLVAEPLAGKGRLVAAPDARATTRCTRTATCSSSAAAAPGSPPPARRAGATILVDPAPPASRSTAICACSRGRRRSAIYDGNYVRRGRARAARSGTSGRSGSCSRPARSSGRSCSRTTTGPGSCSPARPRRTATPAGVHRGVGRLEPARAPLEPGARPAALGRSRRRARARRRAPRRRVRRPSHRRGPARRAAVRAAGRRRGRRVRRPRARRDRRRPPPRGRRRPALGRARQALHDDRHRLRPGQDRRT